MKTQLHKSRYLLLIVGTAVILFSTAGIAAIMGWRPAATGGSGDMIARHNPALALGNTDELTAQAAQRRAKAKARANGTCAECGRIVSMGEINAHDDDFGIGAAGALLAGDRDDKPLNSAKGYEIIVRMADGSSRAINHASPANWRPGARVIIIDGTNSSHR